MIVGIVCTILIIILKHAARYIKKVNADDPEVIALFRWKER